MSRIIAVYGANGSGKSTIASNLAWELSNDYLVGVINTDFNYPSIQHFLGTKIDEEKSLKNICLSTNKDVEIIKQFTEHSNNKRLFILSVPNNSDCLTFADQDNNRLNDDDFARDFWETIKISNFDYVIVDCCNDVNNLASSYALFYANTIIHTIKPTIQGLSFVQSYNEFIGKMQNEKEIVKRINVANADENYVGLSKFESLSGVKFDISLPYEVQVRQAENEGVAISSIYQKSLKNRNYVKVFGELVSMVKGGML